MRSTRLGAALALALALCALAGGCGGSGDVTLTIGARGTAEETILAFAEGRLPAESFVRVQNHALRCSFCQDVVAAAVGTGAVMRTVAGGVDALESRTLRGASSAGPALARGTTIGRYMAGH